MTMPAIVPIIIDLDIVLLRKKNSLGDDHSEDVIVDDAFIVDDDDGAVVGFLDNIDDDSLAAPVMVSSDPVFLFVFLRTVADILKIKKKN